MSLGHCCTWTLRGFGLPPRQVRIEMWTDHGCRSVSSQYHVIDIGDVWSDVGLDGFWWFGFGGAFVRGDEFWYCGLFSVGLDVVCDFGWFMYGDRDESRGLQLQPGIVVRDHDHSGQGKPNNYVHESGNHHVVEHTADVVGVVELWSHGNGYLRGHERLHRLRIYLNDGDFGNVFAHSGSGRRHELQLSSLSCTLVHYFLNRSNWLYWQQRRDSRHNRQQKIRRRTIRFDSGKWNVDCSAGCDEC